MKIKLTALAVAAAIAAPMAAYAETDVSGYLNTFVGEFDSADELQMGSYTSAIGVKGKQDVAYGLQAIYKVEWQFDMSERNTIADTADGTGGTGAITDRDQWVGLASKELGSVRLGTISNNYKSSGGALDPMYRTPFEARNIGAQTNLHSGAGGIRGRSTNTIRYDSPRIAGAKVVANYALSEGAGNVLGAGVHYKMGPILAAVDYLNSDELDGSAIKFGGAYTIAGLTLAAQYEMLDDEIAWNRKQGDTLFVNASYTMGNNMVAFTYGMGDENDNSATAAIDAPERTSWAIMVDHALAKKTDVYVGYTDVDSDNDANDDSGWAVGLRHKF